MSGGKAPGADGSHAAPRNKHVSLKDLAKSLGLSPATVSLVINRSPAARSIPEKTRARVLAEAKRLHYRPNFLARSLRSQRSFTVGVIVPEVSEGYTALVMSGIEDFLLQEGYFYFLASHRHRPDLIDEYPKMFLERAVEGVIAIDTRCESSLSVPVVAVSGHQARKGVTNIALDHSCAAWMALHHLAELGHREIAFIKGQDFSSDTEPRWRAILEAANRLGLPFHHGRTAQLSDDCASPALGYEVTRQLLATGELFTALFAFNDVSAIGAIRALREAGLRVPEDVSVIGFDDIQSAAFQHPGLTTIRQPLRQMGELAARTLLDRISRPKDAPYPKSINVKPELVVRESTAPAPR